MALMPDDRKCIWCGKVYIEHVYERAPGAPVPRMPCQGLRTRFFLGAIEGEERPLGGEMPVEVPGGQLQLFSGGLCQR